MPIDMNVGEIKPDFDGALETMAKITNLAHAQAMAPYQFEQAALANRHAQLANQVLAQMSPLQIAQVKATLAQQQQMNPLHIEGAKLANQYAQLKNKYYPQQMDTSLGNLLAKLSGQKLSSDRFLSNIAAMKNARRGLGSAQMDAVLAKNPQAASQIASDTIDQIKQQAANQYAPGAAHPNYNQQIMGLIGKYINPNQVGAVQHTGMQSPPQLLARAPATNQMQPMQSAAPVPINQNPVSQEPTPPPGQVKAIQDASQSSLLKETTDAPLRARVAAGNRFDKVVDSMMPYLNDYAHYRGLRGAGGKSIDQLKSMFSGNMPPALNRANQFEAMLPILKSEFSTLIGNKKTNMDKEEIDSIFNPTIAETPQSFINKFNKFISIAKKTHQSNLGDIATQYGKGSNKNIKNGLAGKIDILNKMMGR
jgi:hypothetical protein